MMYATYERLGLHVAESNMKVIRAARKRITKKARRDPKFRDARKALYREMLQHHADARELFREYRF